MASLIFLTNVHDNDNVVHPDSSDARITVCDNDAFVDSVDTLKDISKLNNLTKLWLIIQMKDITLHKMNFTNTKIEELIIKVFDLLLKPSFLQGISCIPSLKKLILHIDAQNCETKSLKLRIKNYLDNNKYLKQIEIYGHRLHPNTREELENYCKANCIVFIYEPTKYY